MHEVIEKPVVSSNTIRIRQKSARCSAEGCGELITKHQHAVRYNGGLAHIACAGLEGVIEKCDECFMIKQSCSC